MLQLWLINPCESVDENTILVCAILGTTYTGQYEDVKKIDRLLGEKNEAEGLSVFIHVDGASGGFVAPFANPDLEWDFRLVRILYCEHNHNVSWLICGRFVQPHVCSINASGHKCMLIVEFSSPLLTKFRRRSYLCWCWLGDLA